MTGAQRNPQEDANAPSDASIRSVESTETPKRSKDDERVLVVPTRLFRDGGVFQGFSAEAISRCDALFAPESTRFTRRGDAERNPEFKQLIPYIIFVCEDSATGRPSVFAYRRGDGQGETRLRSKWSVGVGGHINDVDAGVGTSANGENGGSRENGKDGKSGEDGENATARPQTAESSAATPFGTDLFSAGAAREIAEEVVLGAPILRFERVGLVNDDATEVGRVHLGVVCVATLAAPLLTSNEPDLAESGFRPVDELLAEIDAEPERFETWTTLALRGLYAKN
ncbi:MAG: phosphoesterase [Thermoguttaceae bacterium]|nr:phosphoesterase [Thermoguttaceae bacterium]